jgi:hypothetical protein
MKLHACLYFISKNVFFSKMEDKKVRGGEYKERMKEGECDETIMYLCMKMEK